MKNSKPVAVERRYDLATLFCMIGRHGPAVAAAAVIAMLSVMAAVVIYRTVRGKRRKEATAKGDAVVSRSGPEPGPEAGPEPSPEETRSSAESTEESDEASLDLPEDAADRIQGSLESGEYRSATVEDSCAEEKLCSAPEPHHALGLMHRVPDGQQAALQDAPEETAVASHTCNAPEMFSEEVNRRLREPEMEADDDAERLRGDSEDEGVEDEEEVDGGNESCPEESELMDYEICQEEKLEQLDQVCEAEYQETAATVCPDEETTTKTHVPCKETGPEDEDELLSQTSHIHDDKTTQEKEEDGVEKLLLLLVEEKKDGGEEEEEEEKEEDYQPIAQQPENGANTAEEEMNLPCSQLPSVHQQLLTNQHVMDKATPVTRGGVEDDGGLAGQVTEKDGDEDAGQLSDLPGVPSGPQLSRLSEDEQKGEIRVVPSAADQPKENAAASDDVTAHVISKDHDHSSVVLGPDVAEAEGCVSSVVSCPPSSSPSCQQSEQKDTDETALSLDEDNNVPAPDPKPPSCDGDQQSDQVVNNAADPDVVDHDGDQQSDQVVNNAADADVVARDGEQQSDQVVNNAADADVVARDGEQQSDQVVNAADADMVARDGEQQSDQVVNNAADADVVARDGEQQSDQVVNNAADADVVARDGEQQSDQVVNNAADADVVARDGDQQSDQVVNNAADADVVARDGEQQSDQVVNNAADADVVARDGDQQSDQVVNNAADADVVARDGDQQSDQVVNNAADADVVARDGDQQSDQVVNNAADPDVVAGDGEQQSDQVVNNAADADVVAGDGDQQSDQVVNNAADADVVARDGDQQSDQVVNNAADADVVARDGDQQSDQVVNNAADADVVARDGDQQSDQVVNNAADADVVARDGDIQSHQVVDNAADPDVVTRDGDQQSHQVVNAANPDVVTQEQQSERTANNEALSLDHITIGGDGVPASTLDEDNNVPAPDPDPPSCDGDQQSDQIVNNAADPDVVACYRENVMSTSRLSSFSQEQQSERMANNKALAVDHITVGGDGIPASTSDEDLNPPTYHPPLLFPNDSEQRVNDDASDSSLSPGLEESGISSMTLSSDFTPLCKNADDDYDASTPFTDEELDLSVVDASPHQMETHKDGSVACTGMVFGPYPTPLYQPPHREFTSEAVGEPFGGGGDVPGQVIEDRYNLEIDQFSEQVASLTDELNKQTEVKGKKEGGKEEDTGEDYEKTEISIMEATMDNNEWLTDGNQVLPWMSCPLPSFAQNHTRTDEHQRDSSIAIVTDAASTDAAAVDITTSARDKQTSALSLVDENAQNSRKVVAVQPMPQSVNVTFCIHYLTHFPGQTVAVTGNRQELGSWKGFIPLERAKDGYWASIVSLPAESQVEWKFVLVEEGEVCRWEECDNRFLDTGYGDDLHVHKWWGSL